MEKNQPQIDPNTANVEELRQLPGIGEAMAKRIIAARPFQTLQDLCKVSGINEAVLERLQPYLILPKAPTESPAQEEISVPLEESPLMEAAVMETQVETLAEPEISAPLEALPTGEVTSMVEEPAEVSAAPKVEEEFHAELPVSAPQEQPILETPPAIQAPQVEERLEAVPPAAEAPPVAPAQPVKAPEPTPMRQPAGVTVGRVAWIVLAGSLITLILALVLSFGILALLNGGKLRYATPAQVNALTVRLEGLEAQARNLSQDFAGLRTRIDNLETLGGRVSAVEKETQALRLELDKATAQLNTLNGQVEEIQTQVETIQAQNKRFTSFFEGLSKLLDELFKVEAQP